MINDEFRDFFDNPVFEQRIIRTFSDVIIHIPLTNSSVNFRQIDVPALELKRHPPPSSLNVQLYFNRAVIVLRYRLVTRRLVQSKILHSGSKTRSRPDSSIQNEKWMPKVSLSLSRSNGIVSDVSDRFCYINRFAQPARGTNVDDNCVARLLFIDRIPFSLPWDKSYNLYKCAAHDWSPLNKTIDKGTLSSFSFGGKRRGTETWTNGALWAAAEKIFERARRVYLDEIIVQDNYRGSSARWEISSHTRPVASTQHAARTFMIIRGIY